MMTDLFAHHRNRELIYDLKNDDELQQFIKVCPEGAVTMTDTDDAPDKNIYSFNEKVLIKDFLYTDEET